VGVITGIHNIIYAEDPERTRAFIRDVLGFGNVDAGGGWLIFALPPAELGIHPTGPSESGRHELFLMCDDIHRTVEDLTARGVEFLGPVTEQRFGQMVSLKVPGGGQLSLYQPSHPTAIGT
jgi:predicted enzyme related to lactoylglutathione lyase